jgi:hypothetical protein
MQLSDNIHGISALMAMVGFAVQSGGLARAAEPAAVEKREQIGEVLKKPVYRDDIRKNQPLADELHRLFTQPVLTTYRRKHLSEFTPSRAEIDAATAYFDQKHRERIKDMAPALRDELKAVDAQLELDDLPEEKRQELKVKKLTLEAQLTPPGRSFAEFMLNNWKFQRHLYDKFGGGRILWQQAGIEAFDAMRTWLETQEKNGEFKISDSTLRAAFYQYWTTQKHGAFLTSDKDRIREEFLAPEWVRQQPK